MRTKIFVLVILFLWVVPAFAIEGVDTAWVRRYNGPGDSTDYVSGLAIDDSGNVYVTGYSYGIGTEFDYATIKYYPNGDTAWLRRYNGLGNLADYATAMALDSSGNVYVTGFSHIGGSDSDYVTIKYYPNGDTAWVRSYNGPVNGPDQANAIAVDSSGNVYVTGVSYSGPMTVGDYATIKYYPNGETAWVRRYDGPMNYYNDCALAITADDFGNVYVTGASLDTGTWNDYTTIKYYPNGDTAWLRRYNGPGNGSDWAVAIAVDSSGNVYVTGVSAHINIPPGNYDYATIKYYPNGDTAWVRRYNGPADSQDEPSAIAVDVSGNVYVTGYSMGSETNTDYCTIKYYPNGDTAWVRGYDASQHNADNAWDIAVDGSGNVYVTGASVEGGSGEYTTIKYYPNGETAWLRRYERPGYTIGGGLAIVLDGSGDVYVTGVSYDTSWINLDYATIKYVPCSGGDVNGDGAINTVDVVYLINYLFISGPAPQPWYKGDANCDDTINASDVVYLINYLFIGGPPPGC